MESFDTAAVVILTYSMPLEREKNRKGMKSELAVKNKNTVPCSEGNLLTCEIGWPSKNNLFCLLFTNILGCVSIQATAVSV